MRNEYAIQKLDEDIDDCRWLVRNTNDGWFFPVQTKLQAECLYDRFVEITTAPNMKLSIQDCLNEWEKLVNELSEKEEDYYTKKEAYQGLSEEIISVTDFKALYGKNNDSIRKQHVKEELSDEYEELKQLEFRMDYIKRRVSFLKTLVKVKISITSGE